MDPALLQELAKLGTAPFLMAIVIWALWKKLEKREDENTLKDQKITEQFYSAKSQNESIQAVLVVVKDEIKAIRETLSGLQDKIIRKVK